MSNLILKDWTGGIRYTALSQSDKKTSWANARNVELKSSHEGTGICRMKGNINILNNTLPSNTKILGLFEYVKGDSRYMVVNTSEGCFYRFDPQTGILSEPLKFGLSPTARCSYVNFQNGVIVSNGVDDPFHYEFGAEIPVKQCNASRNGVPIRGLGIAEFHNRLFIGVGGTLFYTALGRFDDWTSSDDSGYIANFHNSTASILALEKYGEFLAIHKEGYTFLLSGTSPDDFTISPFTDKGSSSSFGVVNAEGKQFFYNNGVYFLDYNSLMQYKLSDEISPYIKPDLLNLDTDEIRNILAVYNSKKGQILFFMSYINLAGFTVCWIYDFINRCWFKRVQQEVTYACVFDGEIYTGTPDGRILLENFGNTFDGEPIEFFFDTPYFNLGLSSKQKSVEELNILFDYSSVNKFELIYRYNDDDRTEESEAVDSLDPDTLVWDSDEQGLWDICYFSVNTCTPSTFFPPGTFRSLQLSFKGSSLDENFSVFGIEFLNIEMED